MSSARNTSFFDAPLDGCLCSCGAQATSWLIDSMMDVIHGGKRLPICQRCLLVTQLAHAKSEIARHTARIPELEEQLKQLGE